MSDKTCGTCRYWILPMDKEWHYCENKESRRYHARLGKTDTCDHHTPKASTAGHEPGKSCDDCELRGLKCSHVIFNANTCQDYTLTAPTLAKENERLRTAIQKAIDDMRDGCSRIDVTVNLTDALTKKEVDDGGK